MSAERNPAERFESVGALFKAALALPEIDRESWVSSHHETPLDVLDEVRDLLRMDREGLGLTAALDRPARDAFVQNRLTRIRKDADSKAHHEGMLESLSPAPSEGMLLGDYRLIRVLGHGGMGVVWLAEQRSLSREVALKLIRPELMLQAGAIDRFQREARVVAALECPSINRLYEAGEVDGVPFLALEFVPGMTLSQALRSLDRSDPESMDGLQLEAAVRAVAGLNQDSGAPGCDLYSGPWPHVALRIIKAVAGALEFAHGHGVIHRDVKPSNIMLTADGRVLLLDFGIAVDTSSDPVTRTGAVAGSLPYMAPEQLRGDRHAIDERADIYGLGMTMYELLVGELPDSDQSAEVMRERLLSGSLPRASRRNKRVSWETETVCHTAIALHPADRYQTMPEFRLDLERVLDLRPILARPPGVGRRFVRWVQRGPMRASALLFAFVTVLLMLVLVVMWPAILRDREAYVESLSSEGFYALAEKRYTQARKAFESVLELSPSHRESFVGTVLVHLMTHNEDEALKLIDEAPEALREYRALSRLRAVVLIGLGREEDAAQLEFDRATNDDAFTLYVRAVALRERMRGGDELACSEARDLLMRAISSTPVARRMYHFELARVVSRIRNVADASHLSQAMLTLWGHDDWRVWFHVAKAWRRTDFVRSANAYLQSIALRQDIASAHMNLAIVLGVLGEHARAEEHLRELLRIRPPSLETRLKLVTQLVMQDKLFEAERLLSDLSVEYPKRVHLIIHRASILRALGDNRLAEAILRKTLEMRIRPSLMASLACLLAVDGRLKEARDWNEQARKLRPEQGLVLLNDVVFAAVAGESDDAIRKGVRLIEGGSVRALRNLLTVPGAGQGRLPLRVELPLLLALGRSDQASRYYGRARRAYMRALELDPDNAIAALHLSELIDGSALPRVKIR